MSNRENGYALIEKQMHARGSTPGYRTEVRTEIAALTSKSFKGKRYSAATPF